MALCSALDTICADGQAHYDRIRRDEASNRVYAAREKVEKLRKEAENCDTCVVFYAADAARAERFRQSAHNHRYEAAELEKRAAEWQAEVNRYDWELDNNQRPYPSDSLAMSCCVLIDYKCRPCVPGYS